jgi:hypothetical protein
MSINRRKKTPIKRFIREEKRKLDEAVGFEPTYLDSKASTWTARLHLITEINTTIN